MACGTLGRRCLSALVVVGSLLACGAIARAQCDPQWLPGDGVPGVSGPAWVTATWDPDGPGPQTARPVVGGFFSVAGGVLANNIAVFDPATGQWSTLDSGMNGSVTALAALPNGDLVAGGAFTTAGGVSANCIARWSGTGWFALGSGIGGGDQPVVDALTTMPNGDLVIGGSFTTAGGIAANCIARWDGVAWSALGSGVGGGGSPYINALTTLANGDLVAGGSFTTAGGTSVSRIARWDGTAWYSMGGGMNGNVRALLTLSNGNVLAGGSFTLAGSTPAKCIAYWDGTDWLGLGSGMSGDSPFTSVSALAALPNGAFVAGGAFTTAGGVAASRIARWDGSAWSGMGSGMDQEVYALTTLVDGDRVDVVACGAFMTAGGVPVSGTARWNGTAWSTLGSGMNNGVKALATLPSGDLVAGGYFTSAGSVESKSIARWDGTSWSALGLGTSGYVYALNVLSTGDLVAGGNFFSAGAVAAMNIARWNGAEWSALGSGMDADVRALAGLPGGDLAVGGSFTTAGGVAANRIARWSSGTWSAMGSGVGGAGSPYVAALTTLSNGELVVGGNFTTAGSVMVNGIARWDGTVWHALGSGIGGVASPYVAALTTLPNGDLIVGGSFTTAGGVTVNGIARWDGTAWSALGSGLGGVASPFIGALTKLPNGDLVAGGSFRTAGGVTVNNIARWDGTAWSAMGSGVGGRASAYVGALTALPNAGLAAGGTFTIVGGQVSACVGRWTENPKPWIALGPQSQGACMELPVTLSGAPASGYSGVLYQWQRNGVGVVDGPSGASSGGGTVSGASGALASPTDGTGAVLTITGPRPSDSGDYTIVFTNTCGSATSEPATLTVCHADYNCDGFMDGIDYDRFNFDFYYGNMRADYNGDGFVDGIDYDLFNADFEVGCV